MMALSWGPSFSGSIRLPFNLSSPSKLSVLAEGLVRTLAHLNIDFTKPTHNELTVRFPTALDIAQKEHREAGPARVSAHVQKTRQKKSRSGHPWMA